MKRNDISIDLDIVFQRASLNFVDDFCEGWTKNIEGKSLEAVKVTQSYNNDYYRSLGKFFKQSKGLVEGWEAREQAVCIAKSK